ncbi:hypothetical protein BCV70DRAFT_113117 [Testicularia cyperi]|uniref:Uncharacterized protein n=1 Tax=Testicularia cyperi TaxID=1882483 RepID=A0A317XPK1_9BASI|nr:hypothetical protein BCV70DRAFT_113117 [Testicularia cyperi]
MSKILAVIVFFIAAQMASVWAPFMMDQGLFSEVCEAFKTAFADPMELEELLFTQDYHEDGPGWAQVANLPKTHLVLVDRRGESFPYEGPVYTVDRIPVTDYREVQIAGSLNPSKHVYRIWEVSYDPKRLHLINELVALTKIVSGENRFRFTSLRYDRDNDKGRHLDPYTLIRNWFDQDPRPTFKRVPGPSTHGSIEQAGSANNVPMDIPRSPPTPATLEFLLR